MVKTKKIKNGNHKYIQVFCNGVSVGHLEAPRSKYASTYHVAKPRNRQEMFHRSNRKDAVNQLLFCRA